LEAKNLRTQRLESIGTLAGGIAHDLNNILQPITLAMDILRTEFSDPSSREMLDLVTENARRASSLVRQVLSFARGVEGERVSIEPNDLAGEIAIMVRETFPKNIGLRLENPETSWPLSGDSTQLHQVLLNLCVNARDAMADGGVLTIGVENVEIDARRAALDPDAVAGRHVVFTVADTGTGIPPDLHEKIFDPFFTTKGPGNGTGLGLATTLGIVRSHGGFITLKSRQGGGATFRVFIPAGEIESGAAPESVGSAATAVSHGEGELILVVDDEAPILNIMSRTLEASGYRVLTASDGLQGSEVFARHAEDIDVVITDMVMPRMDGAEMIAALKSLRPDIRIIAISGMTTEESIDEINRFGVQRIVSKPFTVTAVLGAVREVLGGKSAALLASSA
jgi:CheY-like chemotaxis protein